MLLTAHDISMRVQHTNAQRTLDRLRALHAVAIVNENDTVATNEIRFGDNDRLSALVAHLVGADALVLLSDIDGLYDSRSAKRQRALHLRGRRPGGPRRRGGRPGQPPGHRRDGVEAVVGAAGRRRRCAGAAGRGRPTPPPRWPTRRWARCSRARPERMSARRFWVRYAAESAGALTLDDGAVRAVVRQRRSLLPAGITAVSGRFYGGDVVELRVPDATMVARGVVAYDAHRTGDDDGPVDVGAARRACAVPPCTPTTWSPSRAISARLQRSADIFMPKSLARRA